MKRPCRPLAECMRLYDTLSSCEKVTMTKLAEGYCTKEIAQDRGVSVKTPERERSNIYRKLGYSNTSQLTFFCLRLGLIKIQKT